MREEAVQVVFSYWMRARALQMKREWQESVQTEIVSGERSVPVMNMKSVMTTFPLRAAKISCLLTPIWHVNQLSLFVLNFWGKEVEMEMSRLPAIGGKPLPYRQQKRVKETKRDGPRGTERLVCVCVCVKWEKTLNTSILLLKKEVTSHRKLQFVRINPRVLRTQIPRSFRTDFKIRFCLFSVHSVRAWHSGY